MKKSVIIVAGGTGSRMQAAIPKQFLLLAGKPVLMHAIEAFTRTFPGISVILVLPSSHKNTWTNLCRLYHFTTDHITVPGGETRFHSVKNALEVLDPGHLTAIHDGARPLVTGDLITRTFEAAALHGNAVPVVPVNESLRQTDGNRNWPVNRAGFYVVQTPQVFPAMVLKNAYNAATGETFTDDATVVESQGIPIHLVDGESTNLKITHPQDLALAGTILLLRDH